MLTQARYESESAVARASGAAATTDEAAMAYGQLADAYATAARHARFHLEWSRRAGSERQAARLGPIRLGGGRGPVNPVLQAQGLAQAERSAQIAINHRQMAEDYAATAEALRPPPAPPGAPDQSLPPVCNTAPYVSGDGVVGATLNCTMGTWTGTPTNYAYQWWGDTTIDLGSTSASYVIVAADSGHSITCVVTASNSLGSAVSPPSNAVVVAGGGNDC
jgi:hypothetical protein